MKLSEIDLHGKTVNDAIEILNDNLKRNSVFILITGYGSKSSKCKIKNAIMNKLDELKLSLKIKAYFVGANLNIFNNDYLKLKDKTKELIRPYIDKLNEGMILIVR